MCNERKAVKINFVHFPSALLFSTNLSDRSKHSTSDHHLLRMDPSPYDLASENPSPQRRLSIKSLAASIRRPKSLSSIAVTSVEVSPISPGLSGLSCDGSKRPSSLFSWRSRRRRSTTDDTDLADTKSEAHLIDGQNGQVLSKKSRKSRRITKELPPLPTLLIDFDSLPTISSTYTFCSPLVDDRFQQNDSYFPPSLPDLRQSTFQPLDVDLYPPPSPSPSHPKSPFEVRKQLALRGPFPSRSRKLIVASFPSPPVPVAVPSIPLPSPPRIDSRSRTSSDLALLLPLPNPAPRNVSPRPPLTRPPSFTASLPTVTEVSRRLLRPIQIAPRSSPSLSYSSTRPSSTRSGYTTRSTSFHSCSSARTSIDIDPGSSQTCLDENEGKIAGESKPKIDWTEIERTLRELSEERLQILLAEVRRAKP